MRTAFELTVFCTVLAAVLSIICASLLEWYLTGVVSEMTFQISVAATLGTFMAMLLCARGILKPGNSPELARRKGLWAGLLSIYFTGVILAIIGMSGPDGYSLDSFVSALFWGITIGPFVMVFGGFFAPVIIGVIGYRLAIQRSVGTNFDVID